MKKQWKRLLVAALISSSVFAVTWFWYASTDSHVVRHDNEKPLAYVGKVVEDIQRRPASRLLWQLVNSGEPLYNGEAIRTSERGEVRIQFVESDRYLDLEPESLIVIKKSEGEIALDLMEGSLFVNANTEAQGTDGLGLVLNSAQGKVDLTQASASLSKGKGNNVDVQVLSGKASIKTEGGASKDLTSATSIKIISPSLDKPLPMDADSPSPVPFEWQGFPANTQVFLSVGPTRKQMKDYASAPSEQKQIKATLPFGRHYWKLVARNNSGETVAETPVYKTELIARYAPTVIFPTADAEIPAAQEPFDLEFKWQKGDDTRQMSLEVWTDASLKSKLLVKSFKSEDSYTLPRLKAGTYYWRMSSYYIGSDRPILGDIQKFTIRPAEKIQAFEPVLVKLTMPESQSTQYFVETPQLGLSWTADKNEKVALWRVKYHSEDEDPALAQILEITETKVSAPVPKPGRYLASIEAIDNEGKILGTTLSDPLTVAPLPLLAAPTFVPTEGLLQAKMDGRTQLEWTPVPGAKEYLLVVRKEGKELKRSKYSTTSTALKNLLPGEYELEIFAVDTHGRESSPNPSRKLLVPDKSNLRAPTLKKIKVN